MPPKKPNQPSKKNVEKQKQKVIEDKTFGIKNKKGAKQQRFIQQVEKQVTQGNKTTKELEKARLEKEQKKEEKKKQMEEIALLFKPLADAQKLLKGEDPKSVLCVYFKNGCCLKGNKCKFSHDLTIERKTAKRNIYENNENEKDDMNDWDINKLEEVIDKRHGQKNKGLPPTTIICKYFLESVEGNKYGWFWECPGGPKCHYKHALPQGYVLKRDLKKLEEQKEVISIEELIEKEREALGTELTMVTFETFIAWKKKKRAEKLKKSKEDKSLKEKEFKQGKQFALSGRELFEFNPELQTENKLEGDDETDNVFIRNSNDDNDDDGEYNGPVRDINLADFGYKGDDDEDVDQSESVNEGAIGGAIDENLFNDEDLDGLDDELDAINIADIDNQNGYTCT